MTTYVDKALKEIDKLGTYFNIITSHCNLNI